MENKTKSSNQCTDRAIAVDDFTESQIGRFFILENSMLRVRDADDFPSILFVLRAHIAYTFNEAVEAKKADIFFFLCVEFGNIIVFPLLSFE